MEPGTATDYLDALVVRDLRILSQPLGGEVLHYRDNKSLEVDAIVQRTDGRWAAIEVTLGHTQVDRAAATLAKFATAVDTSVLGSPSALALITATGCGYQRPDGISVVPIGCTGAMTLMGPPS